MRPHGTAAIGLVVALALTGCTDSGGTRPGEPQASEGVSATTADPSGPSVQRAGGSVILVSAEVDGGMDALMSGVIVRTETGCLALDGPAQPVLWPHGSTLSEDGTSVDVPGFGVVAVGDEVWSGGGNVHGAEEGHHDFVPELPEECSVVPERGSVAALQGLMDGPPPDLP